MCFAALAATKLKELERELGALVDAEEFARIYWERVGNPQAFKLPVAIDREFLEPRNAEEAKITAAIAEYRRIKTVEWETEIFEQRKRHADAERKLAKKVTKAAQNDLRVSANKVQQRLAWLNSFRTSTSSDEDSVVYAMNYAPVIVQTDAGRRITPMRYHCRLPGHAADMDKRLAGNYNARLDSLQHWWRPVFGRHHALLVLTGFRENVQRHDMERRQLAPGEQASNVVLQFNPKDATLMFVPCVWSHWRQGEEVLDSMALITDDPPEEVRQAGHNRCPINLTREAAEAWLSPRGRSDAELFDILAQRYRPFYEHRIADAA
jgi:putative SOS response-associated peptidase YedK